MRHGRSGLSTYGLNGLRQGDEQPYTPIRRHGTQRTLLCLKTLCDRSCFYLRLSVNRGKNQKVLNGFRGHSLSRQPLSKVCTVPNGLLFFNYLV